ncbi:secretion activating protein [Sinorhizobium medicae]|nr:secretion activating protein [Sinorhizobium medicae]
MARENLPDSMRFIMKWEGGFVDDPDDRGGRTNKGITQKVYNVWRRGLGHPSRDVKQIGDGEVQAIYDGNYWTPGGCDLLRRKLDLAQFDTAVNMGTGRAIRILQEAVDTRVDGQFGPTTKRACDACDLGTTLIHYTQIREGLYRRFAQARGQSKFLRGWMNRLNDLRREIGLPGFERIPQEPDFGDMPYIAHIPDLPEGAPLERWD